MQKFLRTSGKMDPTILEVMSFKWSNAWLRPTVDLKINYLSTILIVANILSLTMNVRMLSQGASINECLSTTFITTKEKDFCCWFRLSFYQLWFFWFFIHGLQCGLWKEWQKTFRSEITFGSELIFIFHIRITNKNKFENWKTNDCTMSWQKEKHIAGSK